MKHKGYNNAGASSAGNSLAQKLGFNGKELNDDLIDGNNLDWYDFGARNYDATIGRFMTIDPLTDLINRQSPYVTADNNPVIYVDVHGLGILNVLGNLWRRLVHKVKNIGVTCKHPSGERSIRDSWKMRDFNRKKKPKRRKKSKSTSNSESNTSSGSRPITNTISSNISGAKMINNLGGSNIEAPLFREGRTRGFQTRQIIPAGLMKLGGGHIGADGRLKRMTGIDLNKGITLQILSTIVNTLINNPDSNFEMNYVSPNELFSGNTSRDKRARASVNKVNSYRHSILVRFLTSKGINRGRIQMTQKGNGHQSFQFVPK